jgi:hypothetical protein
MATRATRACAFRFARSATSPRCFSCGSPLQNRRRGDRKGRANPSLFDELFPNQASKSPAQHSSSRERHVPRLSFDKSEVGASDALADAVLTADTTKPEPQWFGKWIGRLGVLRLSGASQGLCENDFRRLTPRGKHIEEWQGKGQIQKGEWMSSQLSFKADY